MVKLLWSVANEQVLDRSLFRFQSRFINAEPAFVAIVEQIKDALTDQFDSEGQHASGGWASLADSTLKAKREQGLDQRILHATQDLRLSLTTETDDTMVSIQPNNMAFGSDLDYLAFHQKGTKSMPARKPLALNELDKRQIIKTLQRFMVYGDIDLEGIL